MGALGEHYADKAIPNFTLYPQTFDGLYNLHGQSLLADVKTTDHGSEDPIAHTKGKQRILAKAGYTFVIILLHAKEKTVNAFLINPNGPYSQGELRGALSFFAEWTPAQMASYLSKPNNPRPAAVDTPAAPVESTPLTTKTRVKSSPTKKRKLNYE